MEVGGQHHAPAALPPEKARYPLYRRLGRPQGRFGRVRIISPPPGFDPRTVQPVAGHSALFHTVTWKILIELCLWVLRYKKFVLILNDVTRCKHVHSGGALYREISA